MKNITLLLCLASVALASCTGHKTSAPATAARSAYYWQTTLRLGKAERGWMERYDVGRVYCRFFDVVTGDAAGGDLASGAPVPNATLQFEDSFPQGVEVVPVVYVTNDCMRQPRPGLAQKILQRVEDMGRANGLPRAKEMQIDCDWTGSTQAAFHAFMQELLGLCHSEGMALSATIRLHQLSQAPPPADHGVLMMYNTGDVTRLDVDKPILDMAAVKPYLRYLKGYKLPLSAAYPLFTWRVLFRGGRYVGIMHGDDDLPVLPGDSIAVRQPEAADIMQAIEAVGEARPDANNEIILFDLSSRNICRFGHSFFKQVFRL